MTPQRKATLNAETERLSKELSSLGYYPPKVMARRKAIDRRLKRISGMFAADLRQSFSRTP